MAIRLGIIGMGYTGKQQRRAIRETPGPSGRIGVPALEVIAATDVTDITKLPEAAGLRIHRDWRALVADDSLDAVSICLPHATHAEVALAALAAGKHVLVEKPLASTAQEARAVVAAAEKAGQVLMVEMTHRFYPPTVAAREIVTSGRIGRLLAVQDRVVSRLTGIGLLAPWMLQRDLAGGGPGLTDCIHLLDRVAFLCRQPLRFISGTARDVQKLGDIEDTAAMALRLADGTPVSVLALWSLSGSSLDDELTVYGTGGTLRVWAWRGWRFEPAEGPPEEHQSYAAGDDHFARVRVAMRAALEEFADAITEKRTPRPSPREILAAQELIAEFYEFVGKRT